MATYSEVAAGNDSFTIVGGTRKRRRASTGSEPADSPVRLQAAATAGQTIVTIRPIVAKQNFNRVNSLEIAKDIHRIAGGSVVKVQKRGNALVVFAQNTKQARTMADQVKFCCMDVTVTMGKPDGSPKKCVIMGIPHKITDKGIVEALSSQGAVDAKRITKKEKGQVQKTMAILVFFKSKIPEYVMFGYEKKKTRPYVPPVMRCFRCQRYGHGSEQCRGRVRCPVCGQGHTWDECQNKDTPKCVRCGGAHSAAYLGCPAYKEAKQIQSYKYREGVSYSNAAKAIKNQKIESVEVEVVQQATKAPEQPKISSEPPNSKGQEKNKGQQKSKIPKRSTQKTNKAKTVTPTVEKTQPPAKPLLKNCECQTDTPAQPTSFINEKFLALIAFVINSLEAHKSKSDRIKLVVNAAEKCCGVKIAANELHEVLAATSS